MFVCTLAGYVFTMPIIFEMLKQGHIDDALALKDL